MKRKISVEQSQVIKETKEEALILLKKVEDLMNKQTIKEHEIADLKHSINKLSIESRDVSKTKDYEYSEGDLVNILKFNRVGELINKQNNGEWIVKMGSLNSQYSEDQFEFIEKKKIEKQRINKVRSKIKKEVSPQLDLRGMRYEEAKDALDRYIDDCLLLNMPFVTIIHGFGTLTLRKLVKSYLDSNSNIKSHRDGEGNEGGNGVTIVHFK